MKPKEFVQQFDSAKSVLELDPHGLENQMFKAVVFTEHSVYLIEGPTDDDGFLWMKHVSQEGGLVKEAIEDLSRNVMSKNGWEERRIVQGLRNLRNGKFILGQSFAYTGRTGSRGGQAGLVEMIFLLP